MHSLTIAFPKAWRRTLTASQSNTQLDANEQANSPFAHEPHGSNRKVVIDSATATKVAIHPSTRLPFKVGVDFPYLFRADLNASTVPTCYQERRRKRKSLVSLELAEEIPPRDNIH